MSLCDFTNENEIKEFCLFNQKINNFEYITQYENNNVFDVLFNIDINIINSIINEKEIQYNDYTFQYITRGGANIIFNILQNNIDIGYILKIGFEQDKKPTTNCFNEICNTNFINIIINKYLSLIHNFCGNNEIGFGFIYENSGKLIKDNNTIYSIFISKKLNFGISNNAILINQYYYELDKLYYIRENMSIEDIQNIILQYLCHIRHLHQLGIVHRDIWYKNVFIRYHENPIDIVLNFTLRNNSQSYNCLINTKYELYISDFDLSMFVNENNSSFFKYKQNLNTSINTDLSYIYMILILLISKDKDYKNETFKRINNDIVIYDYNGKEKYRFENFSSFFLDYIMYENTLEFESEENLGRKLIIDDNINKYLYNIENIFNLIHSTNEYYEFMYKKENHIIEYTKLPFTLQNNNTLLYRGFIHTFPFNKIKRNTKFILGKMFKPNDNVNNENILDHLGDNIYKNINIYQMMTTNIEKSLYFDLPNIFDICELTIDYDNISIYVSPELVQPSTFISTILEKLTIGNMYIFINGGFYNNSLQKPLLVEGYENTTTNDIINYGYTYYQNIVDNNCMEIMNVGKYKNYITITNNTLYFRETHNKNDTNYLTTMPIFKFYGKHHLYDIKKQINELNEYIMFNDKQTDNMCPEHLDNPNPRLLLLLEYKGIHDNVSELKPNIQILNFGGRQVLSEGIRIIDIVEYLIQYTLQNNNTYILCNLDGGHSANIYYYNHMNYDFDKTQFIKENIDYNRRHTHFIMFEFKHINVDIQNIKQIETILNYSNSNLNEIPNIQYGVKELDLSNNKINTITNLPNSIKTLLLQNNNITNLNNIPNRVEYLDISNNNIININSLPNTLSYINISNNNITDLTISNTNITYIDSTLIPIDLEKLSLNNNKIINFDLSKNNKLKYLDLSNNQLIEIKENTLPNTIIELYLQKNNIQKITNLPNNIKFISLSDNNNLFDLDLSNLSIESLSNSILPNNIKYLNISNNYIKYINTTERNINIPKTLEYIDINGNTIETLIIKNTNIIEINGIPNTIKNINVSNNKLKNINIPQDINIKSLDLSRNKFTTIPILSNNIDYLNLSRNQIQNIQNLTNTITKLDLSMNQIQEIKNLTNNIIELDLSNNQIQEIKNLTNNITKLNLSNNQIQEIKNLTNNIIELDLSTNQIQEIKNLTNNIKNLNISNNQIQEIKNLTNNIIELDLSTNKIQEIKNLTNNIIELNVSNNQIQEIKNITNNITKLNLSRNQIQEIKNLTNNIVKLDLSRNQIQNIQNITNNITNINVSNNQIQNIQDISNTYIKKIFLSNNNIQILVLPQNYIEIVKNKEQKINIQNNINNYKIIEL
jgi:Leucine-rich repeat (LRR) protein